MRINIANDTKQHWVFHYRLRGDGGGMPGPFTVEIPSGRQAEIGETWSRDDIFFVVEQLERHGARDAGDLQGSNLRKHLGLLYRIDGVIKRDEIEVGHAAVVDAQERRSAAEATKSALAFDRAANREGRGKRLARMTEVEVEQLVDPRERRTGNEIMFKIGIDTDGNAEVPLAS